LWWRWTLIKWTIPHKVHVLQHLIYLLVLDCVELKVTWFVREINMEAKCGAYQGKQPMAQIHGFKIWWWTIKVSQLYVNMTITASIFTKGNWCKIKSFPRITTAQERHPIHHVVGKEPSTKFNLENKTFQILRWKMWIVPWTLEWWSWMPRK
jgi:hypothetical protein